MCCFRGWVSRQTNVYYSFVVLNEGYKEDNVLTRDLKDYAKEKLLPHKYPRSIVYLKSLPKTGSGKIDRQKLN